MIRGQRLPLRHVALVLMILAGASCAKRTTPPPGQAALLSGFTCCNLHYEGDWINDGNYAELPMIPAGTVIKITSYGGNWAGADIGGKRFRLGHDYGREQESLEQWVGKLVVKTDPHRTIAGFPADVQEAIRLGKVMPGMTREQAIISVGYPLTSENPSVNGPMWRLWLSSFDEYQLTWDQNGRVQEIVADPTVRSRVVHQPGARATAPTAPSSGRRPH